MTPERTPDLVLVAALDRSGAIGRDGQLLWRLPDDLRRFRRLTTGGVVLVGRRTAESIGRALPQRRTLVLTRSGRSAVEGTEPVASLEGALAAAGDAPELLVAGGGEVYALALPTARRLHLTLVDAEAHRADAWFPAWSPADWVEVHREEHPADDRHPVPFAFVDLVRRP